MNVEDKMMLLREIRKAIHATQVMTRQNTGNERDLLVKHLQDLCRIYAKLAAAIWSEETKP